MAEYTIKYIKWQILRSDFPADDTIVILDAGGQTMAMISLNWDKAEANAQLIVSAVNSCISLNKENPLAVAEGIENVVESLGILTGFVVVGAVTPEYEQVVKRGRQALAKIEGGK